MTTNAFIGIFIGPHYHGQSIPANHGTNTSLHKKVTRHPLFTGGGNRVAIGSGNCLGHPNPGAIGSVE